MFDDSGGGGSTRIPHLLQKLRKSENIEVFNDYGGWGQQPAPPTPIKNVVGEAWHKVRVGPADDWPTGDRRENVLSTAIHNERIYRVWRHDCCAQAGIDSGIL